MSDYVLSLAREFTRHPGPRRISQGPNSGEKFRKLLVKRMRDHDRITVDLDGTSGIGSSFLDEAFGGLVFAEGFSRKDVESRVKVKSDLDSSYIITVQESIKRAKSLVTA